MATNNKSLYTGPDRSTPESRRAVRKELGNVISKWGKKFKNKAEFIRDNPLATEEDWQEYLKAQSGTTVESKPVESKSIDLPNEAPLSKKPLGNYVETIETQESKAATPAPAPAQVDAAATTNRVVLQREEGIPLKKLSFTGTTIDGVQASVTTRPAGIASLDAINKSATEQQKIASADLTAKEEERKKIDGLDKATTAANIINATNAAVGLGLGIYGASQINKMQRPAMVSAPQIEAAKIRDTGAQMMAARRGMIEQSANTSREALRRAGRSDLNATITAGETRALNAAAGSIEGMRANINAANVAAENRVREINASTKMQADQFNSQIQASFNQFRSQLGSQNLSTTVQNVSANLGGIAQNNYAKALRERDEELQMKIAISNALNR